MDALWPPAAAPRSRACDLDVVGLGECSVDHVCVVERMPAAGAKTPMTSFDTRPGGQVATALLGCARLGLRCGFIGSVGEDPAVETALAPLREAGVDLACLRRVAGAVTRTAVIFVSAADGERTVLWRRDPALALRPAQLERRQVVRGRVLHVDASDPEASAWAARVAREAGIPVVLDADHLWKGAEELLALVDFPVVSRALAEELGGTGRVRDGLEALAAFGGRLAVVTLGEGGAIARAGDATFESPAFRSRVRDTTGAGDAFHAGFIWSLARGRDVEAALREANAVAALNCEGPGAQGGLPDAPAVERCLRERERRGWREPDGPEGR